MQRTGLLQSLTQWGLTLAAADDGKGWLHWPQRHQQISQRRRILHRVKPPKESNVEERLLAGLPCRSQRSGPVVDHQMMGPVGQDIVANCEGTVVVRHEHRRSGL